MQYRAALAAAALTPLAAAFSVTVTSNCDYEVYGWNVVDSYGSGEPTFTLSSGSNSWSGDFESKTGTGGPSIKLQKVNSLFENAEQSQVEYDMAGSTLFYDFSNINGFPFSGDEVVMQTSNPSCPTVQCLASDTVCSQAYNAPNDIRTLACDGGANIEVLLCGSSSGGSSSGSSGSSDSSSSAAAAPSTPQSSSVAAPAPQPTSSAAAVAAPKPTTLTTQAAPAPAPTQAASQQEGGGFLETGPDGDVEVVVATTVVAVTSVVHVPGPSAEPEAKREAEAHLHAHLHRGHSRVMGRHAH